MKEFWNERFGTEDYFYGKDPNQFLKRSSSLLSPRSRVLCLGEGEGRNAVFLAEAGHEVSAVDVSLEGQKKAQRLAIERQVEINYILEDLATFDMGKENWDAIISIFCHLPPETRSLIHKKVTRGLKTGGLFIIQAYNPDQLMYKSGGPKDIQMLYTREILITDFPDLSWRILENTLEKVYEGIGHQGMSSLLNGIGVK